MAPSAGSTVPNRRRPSRSKAEAELDDHYLIALARQGKRDAYDRIVRRYHGFVRLKASSYFLIGGDSDDLVQEGLVGLYKAVRDYRSDRESSFRTSPSSVSRARSSPRSRRPPATSTPC